MGWLAASTAIRHGARFTSSKASRHNNLIRMPQLRRIFTIFFASPSDVAEERNLAEVAVASVNRSVANQLGWQVDLAKWEQSTPTFGRPQSAINALVDSCDLFVGLVWQRWGQPTGQYSSGFEEEFERAMSRRRSGTEPEIWLYLKKVEHSGLLDPGEQLKKVLEFKELQQHRGEVFFREVESAVDWKQKFQDNLSSYVLSLALKEKEITNQTVLSPIQGSEDSTILLPEAPRGSSRLAEFQIKSVSIMLSEFASRHGVEIFEMGDGLTDFDIVRLFLLTSTLISRKYTNVVMGVHEINLLYKDRGKLDAAFSEKIEILRSMIGRSNDTTPGWFWLQDQADEGLIFDLLFKLSIDDVDGDVRSGALELLTLARFKMPREWWPSLPLRHESHNVRAKAFHYLAQVGDGATVEFLDTFITDTANTQYADAARNARFHIISRLDPRAAFTQMLQRGVFVSPERNNLIKSIASSVDDDLLLGGIESSSDELREISTRELLSRRPLPANVAQKLLDDPSFDVRALVLLSLAKNGELIGPNQVREVLKDRPLDRPMSYLEAALGGPARNDPKLDADFIVLTFFSLQPSHIASAAVDWFSADGVLAYKALALYNFDLIEPNIIDDLASGFSRVKLKSIERLLVNVGEDAARELTKLFDHLDEFIRSQFTEAALLGIAKNGLPSAAQVAFPYLSDSSRGVKAAAVKVIAEFGDSMFADNLKAIAMAANGPEQKDAALGALRLASSPSGTAVELFGSDIVRLGKIAFSWIIEQTSYIHDDDLTGFLHVEDEYYRLNSLTRLSKRLNHSDLELLLHSYVGSDNHFYDVVTWLDRLLYAPHPLRQAFLKELELKTA